MESALTLDWVFLLPAINDQDETNQSLTDNNFDFDLSGNDLYTRWYTSFLPNNCIRNCMWKMVSSLICLCCQGQCPE